MAQARPGPKAKQTTLTKGQPIQLPAKLTHNQSEAAKELQENPYLSQVDSSLIKDYLDMIELRDTAFERLKQDGPVVPSVKGDTKRHPAYGIWRDASDRIMKLRGVLLMTPASRIAAKQTVTVEAEDEAFISLL